MRPEISVFVRELTYPELKDAPSTYQRSDIRGVHSNVIFVNHDHPEDENSNIDDRGDGGAKSSKQNTYEVQMVLKIVRYLAQQGYKSENIVVLTPYLGQLHQLRDALKHDNDPILNDLDSSDLASAGISTSDVPYEVKAKRDQIHLATIDNYQGEESDIVVTSLTRSNKTNAIGFMDSPERLNVLLSRARDGLILIGNSQTFLQSRKGGGLWQRFFTLLEKGQYVFQGFPVKCQRHPDRAVLLQRASDFDEHCPGGGCTEVCGFTLACGHTCPMKCHPDRSSALYNPHDWSECRIKLSRMCPAGHHRISWECHLPPPSVCPTCAKEAKRLEEIARQEREAQKKREEAEAEHRRQLAELLQVQRAAEEQRRLQEEREARTRERLKRQEEEARRKRQEEEEERKREEEKERLRQDNLRRVKQYLEEEREAEIRQREELAAAERRERRREDAHSAAVARAKSYYEEQKRKANEESKISWERLWRHEEEARRKRQEEGEVEDRKRQEERERLRQDNILRTRQRLVEEREAEIRRREEAVAAAERLVAERRCEDVRAAEVARAKVYDEEQKKKANEDSKPSSCTIQ